MAGVDRIIAMRRSQRPYDAELWTFMKNIEGRNLRNLADRELTERLISIDRNIQYLDSGFTARDKLEANNGWLSPWWWLRARHWTLLEFEDRGIVFDESPQIPSMPLLSSGLDGVVSGGRRMLVRISTINRLMDTLRRGSLPFAPASSYRDPKLDAARMDDELRKDRRRPGQVIQISDAAGKQIRAIGDVVFSARRAAERNGELFDYPYWMCCFSSDLDPRLFDEFKNNDPAEHGCIIIFDPDELVRRALPTLNKAAPFAVKSLFPVDYFDPHYANGKDLSALQSKDFRYACQREMRFVLDPEGRTLSKDGGLFIVSIGALTDIAGVYSCDGRKLAGAGPANFLA